MFEPSYILEQLLFMTEKYPIKCFFINASSSVVSDTLVFLLDLNACYTERTPRTPITVHEY